MGICLWLAFIMVLSVIVQSTSSVIGDETAVNNIAKSRQKRQMTIWASLLGDRWSTVDENGHLTIFYKIDSAFTKAAKMDKLRDAATMWAESTCINFVEVPEDTVMIIPHIRFTNIAGDGCFSGKGMPVNNLERNINMEENSCIGALPGRILHEIGHALGINHQHQRYDRDDFITVHTDNIQNWAVSPEYGKKDASQITTHGVPYDLASILHYSATAFAKDITQNTMTTVDPVFQNTMGNLDRLTFFDTKLTNIEYCLDACQAPVPACQRGGYPDPRDCTKCHCIEGFKDLCDTVDDSDASCRHAIDGGVIDVTSQDWTCTTLGPYQWGLSCNWHLKAGEGKKIEFKLNETAVFDVYCGNVNLGSPCRHYVEVKYKDNLSTRGPRLCCPGYDVSIFNGPTGYVTSEDNEILVTFRSVQKKNPTYGGFTMCYRTPKSCAPGMFGMDCQWDATCLYAVNASQRIACKESRKWRCINKEGCCYDKRKGMNWCYQHLDVTDLGPIMETNSAACEYGMPDPSVRNACGYSGISEGACRAIDCCWDKVPGFAYCFKPLY